MRIKWGYLRRELCSTVICRCPIPFIGGHVCTNRRTLFGERACVADFRRMTCSVHPSISTLVAAIQFQKLSILLAPIAAAMRVQPEKGTAWPNWRRLVAVWAVRLTHSINYQALALSLRRGLFLFSTQAVMPNQSLGGIFLPPYDRISARRPATISPAPTPISPAT